MFRDLLVATTGHGDDAAAFSTGCALAGTEGHVNVLVQARVPIPDVGGAMGMFPVEAYVALHDQLRADGEAACARWRGALEHAGVMGEVRFAMDAWSSPSQTAAQHAHYADLSVVGLGARGSLPYEVHDQVAKLLTGSGRPVLAVPHGARPPSFTRAVIGWKPGAHAVRAVHDAMPWLARAAAVVVVCVNPVKGESAHGDEPGADIARHLARLGLPVTVQVDAGAADEPGEALLRRCRELGAGVLVMGGYGHSRLREWALGGTTRYMLKHADVPLFLSH